MTDLPGQTTVGESSSSPRKDHVFVCYSHANRAEVLTEIAELRSDGIHIWFDEGIHVGSEWTAQLAEAIEGCRQFLFFATRQSVDSKHCRDEIHYALKHHKSMVIVYLDDTQLPSGLDLVLSSIQALHRNSMDTLSYRQKLVQALSRQPPDGLTDPLTRQDADNLSQPSKQLTPPSRFVFAWLAALFVIVAGVAYLYWHNQSPPTSTVATGGQTDIAAIDALRSVAILPFRTAGQDQALSLFVDGVVDSVLDELTATTTITVASRTAAFQLAEAQEDVQSIAKNLNVAYVVEGSAQQMGQDARISARLLRAADGHTIWSKTYPLSITGGFETQSRVAGNLSNIVRSKIFTDIRRQHPNLYAELRGINPAALSYFADSEELWEMIVLGEGGDNAYYLRLLEKAVEIDPTFAYALREIAWTYAWGDVQTVSFKTASAKAHTAIEQADALGLDETERVFIYANIYLAIDLDFEKASAYATRGIDLLPESTMSYMILAMVAGAEGRSMEAAQHWATAFSVDTGRDPTGTGLLYAPLLLSAGEYEQSLTLYNEALEMIAAGPVRAQLLRGLADALIMLGQSEAAEAAIAEGWAFDGASSPAAYAHLYAKINQQDRARDILSHSLINRGNAKDIALAYLALGDAAQALEAIRVGIEQRNTWIGLTLPYGRPWDSLRGDPKFDELLQFYHTTVKHTARYLQDHPPKPKVL